MQGDGKGKAGCQIPLPRPSDHMERKPQGNADGSGGDGMEQGRAQKSELAGQEPNRDFVQSYRFYQKKGIFQSGKAQSRGNHVNRPVQGFIEVGRFVEEENNRQEFNYFFGAGPEDDLPLVRAYLRLNEFLDREHKNDRHHSEDENYRQEPFRLRPLFVFLEPEPKPNKRGDNPEEKRQSPSFRITYHIRGAKAEPLKVLSTREAPTRFLR